MLLERFVSSQFDRRIQHHHSALTSLMSAVVSVNAGRTHWEFFTRRRLLLFVGSFQRPGSGEYLRVFILRWNSRFLFRNKSWPKLISVWRLKPKLKVLKPALFLTVSRGRWIARHVVKIRGWRHREPVLMNTNKWCSSAGEMDSTAASDGNSYRLLRTARLLSLQMLDEHDQSRLKTLIGSSGTETERIW